MKHSGQTCTNCKMCTCPVGDMSPTCDEVADHEDVLLLLSNVLSLRRVFWSELVVVEWLV